MKKYILLFFMTISLYSSDITTAVDKEYDMLNNIFKKEIELFKMIESYITTKYPNDGTTLDYSAITRENIQEYYNLSHYYFNNFNNNSICTLNSNDLCSNGSGGINITVNNKGIILSNLLGQVGNRTKNIFNNIHLKNRELIYTYDSVTLNFSNEIKKTINNIENFNSYNFSNYELSDTPPTDLTKIWVRPNENSDLIIYSYNGTKWDYIGKNLPEKIATVEKSEDLYDLNSFSGSIVYAGYENNSSEYTQFGEMQFINTGMYLNTTPSKSRWSMIGKNNLLYVKKIKINNECTEHKNRILGSDSSNILYYKNGSYEKYLSDDLAFFNNSVSSISNTEIFYYYRRGFNLLDNDYNGGPNGSINYYLDYNSSTQFDNMQDMSTNSISPKLPENNILYFNILNKIDNTILPISKIRIRNIKIYDNSLSSFVTLNLKSGTDTILNSNQIKIILDTTSENYLKSIGSFEYIPNKISETSMTVSEFPNYYFDTADNLKYYEEVDNTILDSNIDSIKGFPILVDYELEFNQGTCPSGYNLTDCYIVDRSSKGCYIKEASIIFIKEHS